MFSMADVSSPYLALAMNTREIVLAAAIVAVLSFWFIDRQILLAVWESLKEMR
jgi:hypothetical protein